MRPTALISLAQAILHASSHEERTRLHASCPTHLRDLLKTNICMIREQHARKRAMHTQQTYRRRAGQHVNPYATLYQPKQPPPVVQSVALNNVANLRKTLGSHQHV